MGEVGAVIPEKQSESPASATPASTVNGDVNGLCKLSTSGGSTSEPMDVDTEDDSQVSSENGVSDLSENHNTALKLPIISKAESLGSSPQIGNIAINNKMMKSPSIHSEENSRQNLEAEDDFSRDQQSNNEMETEMENSQGDENTRTTTTTNDENSHDGIDDPKEDLSSRDNDVNMSTEGEETTNDNSTQHNTLEEENSQSSQNSEKSENGLKENGIKSVAENMNRPPSNEAEDEETRSSNKEVFSEHKTKENGEVNGTKTAKATNDTDDITIIESDEDDNETAAPRSAPPAKTNTQPIPKHNSSLLITKVQSNVEQPKVDSTTDKNSKGNGNTASATNPMDDDAPVIIPSDSESDDDSSKQATTPASSAKPPPTDEDMSGDDCVVIEDDDKKDKELDLSQRTMNRQRKSIVRPRDVEDDDDVAEIVDDDLPPSKKARTGPLQAHNATPNIQLGQITIKDPRSLMQQFTDSVKSTFQQQFAQTVGMVGANAPKPVAGILPISASPQGIFPNNIRPSLAPLSVPPKLVPTTPPVAASPTLPVSNPTLLPALTDDMFVLEAPSFIVPYIYEKPPSENLKEVVAKLETEIAKLKKEVGAPASEEIKKEETAEKSEADEKPEGTTEEEKGDDDKAKKKKKSKSQDDSWDELDTSTDEEASDGELRTKVLIKDVKPDLDTIKAVLTDASKSTPAPPPEDKKSDPKNENYFESPLGKFFIDIGINLVQEYVQTDLLRIQKRKLSKSLKSATAETELAIRNLQKNIEASKKRNEPYKFDLKRCEYCNFKSESALSMAHHYETPHMRQYLYKCNFCSYETRPAHDILFHMEAVHNVKGRLEKALAYNQCPNCPFEENGKAKFARHVPVCAKKFRPEVNLQPPHDWEAPAKIPRIKPRHGLVGTATAYQAMAAQAAAQKAQLAAMAARAAAPVSTPPPSRNRGGRPAIVPRMQANAPTGIRGNAPLRPPIPGVVLPTGYQIAPGGQIIQQPPQQQQQSQTTKKNSGQQPSISITPLPRQPGNVSNAIGLSATAAMPPKPPAAAGIKPGQAPTGGKASFVICEICDGYIKDLEQLRNHMQWMHKVKIHPKMIHNRPPLNCQKCQFRFFTDQGLERHLLGSHGLVTSSMQEAANKGKDAGRCPVCGRMYQWKLLNHVSRDHHMTLKPAHLSYKCTVCTATFGMYKQFENHVYTAHSTVAKKAMDGKKNSNSNNPMAGGSGSSVANLSNMSGISVSTIGGSSKSGGSPSLSTLSSGDSLLKPLKINDEITIIPQPASKSRSSMSNDYESHLLGKSSNRR